MGQHDIALRHVVQQQVTAVAAGLAPGFPIESATWIETQLTAMERRCDKALELCGGGQSRLLHLEFLVDPGSDLGYRMYEYNALLVISLHTRFKAQLASAPDRGAAACEVPPVKSVALVLSGRAQPWPAVGQFRTSWPEEAEHAVFSGHHFQIEPVYQRSVAQLMARPGAFWLVFTPLAFDANIDRMRQVLAEIQRREPGQKERGELYTALLVMAELDPWTHGLRKGIKMLVQEMDRESILAASETFREFFEDGRAKGIEEGKARGIELMLQSMLVRALRRELTPEERAALPARVAALHGEEAAANLLDLGPDALLAWLHGPDAE